MNGNNDEDNICRDYLRNVCTRGARCRYRHPESKEPNRMNSSASSPFLFCHDYQNKECSRPNCRFIHCTRQEEDYFRSSGHLPPNVLDQIIASRQGSNEMQSTSGEAPICKDFLNGDCNRGGRCRFRHIQKDEDEKYRRKRRSLPETQFSSRFSYSYEQPELYEPEPKRRTFNNYYPNQPMEPAPRIPQVVPLNDYPYLEESENVILRRTIEGLKKQVAHLMTANEFLLEQNAQLRIGKSTGIAPEIAASAQMVSSVSLTSVPQSMISGASTSLVSYPIMTQSMRPVIQANLGH